MHSAEIEVLIPFQLNAVLLVRSFSFDQPELRKWMSLSTSNLTLWLHPSYEKNSPRQEITRNRLENLLM